MKWRIPIILAALSLLGITTLAQNSHDSGIEIEIEEDTPVMFTDKMGPVDPTKATEWTAPDYSGQEKSLGYAPGVFGIPRGMEERVQFWKDIYTKYSTDQGILHDSKYLQLVYETVDFTDIMKDPSIGNKERARRKRVDEAKRRIKAQLEHMETLKSGDGLTGEDLRYWNLFAKVEDKNRFREASVKGRLRFQLGQRDRFASGIFQMGRYIKQMEAIFVSEGLPRELTRLPFVESSFNLKARSKVGASGVWQFMRSAARQYMKMNFSCDERNDPLTATRAAARKMKDDFALLGTWPLAVTAYNHGPSGMRRLVQKFGTKDLAELTDVRKGRFGFASANFYATFLAAIEVEREAPKYFGKVYRMPELRGSEIPLDKNLSIARLMEWFGGDEEKARDLNPHINPYIWKGGSILKKNFIRVPEEILAKVNEELKNAPEEKVTLPEGVVYPVARGETLSDIADRFRIPLRAIMDANGIGDPRRLREGQKLVIPGTGM